MFIDEKELKDSEVYKAAGLDRKLFSKIRSNRDYRPKKGTVIALALALQLNLEEAEELLNSAGYTLADGCKYDVIVTYCIAHEIFNVRVVNEALRVFGQRPLL